MRSAVIRERPGSVEGMGEGRSLTENPRVPQPARHPRGTRGTAVSARAPHPLHRIARVDRHGGRREKEPSVANCHGNRGRTRHRRSENQEQSDNHRQYRDAS